MIPLWVWLRKRRLERALRDVDERDVDGRRMFGVASGDAVSFVGANSDIRFVDLHVIAPSTGGGYYTVSANLAEIEVKVGDDVKGGGRIATLGGGSAGSTLYFEVRIGQETADPAEWFGI